VQERRLELDPPEVYHRPMDAEWRLLITTESTVIPSSVVEWWYSTHLFLRSNSADPKAKACSQTLKTQPDPPVPTSLDSSSSRTSAYLTQRDLCRHLKPHRGTHLGNSLDSLRASSGSESLPCTLCSVVQARTSPTGVEDVGLQWHPC
jgi:hypothetical protein